MNSWSMGTTKDDTIMHIVYKEIIRIEIFREAIFMLSASARDLLSAAVAATISIPTYEKMAPTTPVLVSVNEVKLHARVWNLPHAQETSCCAGNSFDSLAT